MAEKPDLAAVSGGGVVGTWAACAAVQSVIKGRLQPCPATIAEMANKYATAADQEAFVQMLSEALHQLHEGSIARYRLRRSEYIA